MALHLPCLPEVLRAIDMLGNGEILPARAPTMKTVDPDCHVAYVPLAHAVGEAQHEVQNYDIELGQAAAMKPAQEKNQIMSFWKTAKLGVAIGAVAYLAAASATKTQSGALVGAGAGRLLERW
jgi:hypothetical protein